MTIYDAVRRDYESFEQLFGQLEQTTDVDNKLRMTLIASLHAALERAFNAEFQTIIPVLQRFPVTRNLASKASNQVRYIRGLVHSFKELVVDAPQWETRFLDLKSAIEDHMEEMEHKVFPGLKDVLNNFEASDLGAAYADVKAKTRTLPDATNQKTA